MLMYNTAVYTPSDTLALLSLHMLYVLHCTAAITMSITDDSGAALFVKDMRQIWLNCFAYNSKGSGLWRLAALLNHFFETW
jgi:hypothetical protein